MKRIFCLILVFVAVLALASCSKKKKSNDYEERISKEIAAEEGGKIESSDGKTSVDIPAGALDEDTTITMTIRNAEGYEGTEDMDVVGLIVEFEPSGKVFKKPVIVTMPSLKTFERKVVSAAVLHGTGEKWSYSEHGAMALLHQEEKDDAGDPIITTVAGDKVMLSAAGDPIMQSSGEMLTAAGDPIMLGLYGGMSSAGDPIMTTAAGDPIMMTSAAGDPIMSAAAGNQLMMATGHFSAYTFVIAGRESAEKPDDDDNDADIDMSDEENIPDETEDEDEIPDEIKDEDKTSDADVDDDPVIPGPEPVYSKLICTGSTRCSADDGSFIDCPEEGKDFYGQDAQYAAKKSCVPAKYTKILPDPEALAGYTQVVDEVTGLRWIVDISGQLSWEEAKNLCEDLDYGGFEDWRLPTMKEIFSIAVGDTWGHAVREFYFPGFYYGGGGVWASQKISADKELTWSFYLENADMYEITNPEEREFYLLCVRGDEYGKVSAENYTVVEQNGDEMIKDSSTDLFWQKGSVQVETWKEALAYCENSNYAGYSDWRLPNRNELLSLVDYSKAVFSEPTPEADPEAESVVVSSFPGMTAETFFSSTAAIGYGGTSGIWAVDMSTGLTESLYGNASVRCVRSDTVGYPDGMNMPYCDETGVAPCKNKASGITWSPVFSKYDNNTGNTSWQNFAGDCRASVFAGNRKWRIPTIDEVRTLATNCGELKAGGKCSISDNSDNCVFEGGCESDLHDFGPFLSSTHSSEDEIPWLLNFKNGTFEQTSGFYYGVFRCVMDEDIPEFDFPYTDPATGIIWSDISPDTMPWDYAEEYCGDLPVKDDGKYWTLPTLEQLFTLVRSCGEDVSCEADPAGGYSLFGDASELWASDYSDENSETYTVDFMYATSGIWIDWHNARVRCVLRLKSN